MLIGHTFVALRRTTTLVILPFFPKLVHLFFVFTESFTHKEVTVIHLFCWNLVDHLTFPAVLFWTSLRLVLHSVKSGYLFKWIWNQCNSIFLYFYLLFCIRNCNYWLFFFFKRLKETWVASIIININNRNRKFSLLLNLEILLG